MKSDPQHIEELIRSKLGEAEVTPSEGVWKGVQRQLRMKKFLRFDPGGFNLYYLAGLVIAGSALVALISTGPHDRDSRLLTENQPENPAGISTGQEQGLSINQEGEGSAVSAGSNNAEGSEPGDRAGKRSRSAAGKSAVTGSAEAPLQESAEGEPSVTSGEPGEELPQQHTLVTYFTTSVASGCAPVQVQFINASVNATSVTWSFGTGEVTTEKSPVYLFSDPGTYTITLHAEGADGQRSSHQQVIEVYPVPVAGFEIEEGIAGADGVESLELMNYSTGAFAYAWDLSEREKQPGEPWGSNEFQPSIRVRELPRNARSVRLVAVNAHGCSDTSIVEIPDINGAKTRTLEFPTAFSPSPTGPTGGSYSPHEKRTDLFHPNFSEVPGEYHLQVFSRMGEVVFETRDIYQGWDGYIQQEKAAVSVYLWVAEGTWENGSAFNLKGDVTLLWTGRWP